MRLWDYDGLFIYLFKEIEIIIKGINLAFNKIDGHVACFYLWM